MVRDGKELVCDALGGPITRISKGRGYFLSCMQRVSSINISKCTSMSFQSGSSSEVHVYAHLF
jgi:hypothetical protein